MTPALESGWSDHCVGWRFLLNLTFLVRFSEALASVRMKKSVLVCISFLSKLVLGPCPLLNDLVHIVTYRIVAIQRACMTREGGDVRSTE